MKKEIEFDFAKWGQEGVFALNQNGNEVLNIIELKQPIKGWVFVVEINGESPMCINILGMNQNSGITIKMFEEVKPREFWVNVSQDEIKIYESAKEAAFFLRENSQTIKVREVIE
jgi:hypothetical protein